MGLQARGSAGWTPDKTSVSAAVRKLESLIKQLDSLLPYLSVAINAVNLLNSGAAHATIRRLQTEDLASLHLPGPFICSGG